MIQSTFYRYEEPIYLEVSRNGYTNMVSVYVCGDRSTDERIEAMKINDAGKTISDEEAIAISMPVIDKIFQKEG